MNSTKYCASDEEMILQTSILLRVNVIFMSTLGIITLILSVNALKVLQSRIMFHPSTKMLLLTSLFFVNSHEIVFMYIQIVTLVRSFVLSDSPCEIMRTTLECRYQNHALIFCLTGIILIQLALSIERLCATVIPTSYASLRKGPGVVLSVIVVIVSLSAPFLIVWEDPYDDMIPNCFFFPRYSAFRANIYLMILSGVIIVCILANFIIICVNKKLELSMRFHVAERYQKREALISTRIICYIAGSQCFGISFYTCIVLALRLHRRMIPVSMYHNVVWWAYTIPFATASLPALLINRIQRVGVCRKRVITKITARNQETQEDHMKSLKELWS